MKKFLIFLLLLFLSALPFGCFAVNPSDVVINEIAWMGTKVEGVESKNWWRYEWLELYNNTSSQISLDGWKIELYRTGLDWSLGLTGIIQPNSYFLIVSSDKIPNYDLNYSNLGGKFNNSGQRVVLKDNLGNIIDEVDCFSHGKWFSGNNDTKQTMERINPAISGNSALSWQTSQNTGGTPRAQNSAGITAEPNTGQISTGTSQSSPEPIVEQTEATPTTTLPQTPLPLPTVTPVSKIEYPSGIVFNEILPSPEGADDQNEWVEIYNRNNFEVDLTGWKIQDTEGKVTIYTIPNNTKIKAKNYLVLPRPLTKITLNNTGDGLKLSQPNNKVIDSVTFQKAPTGQSYNKTDSGWVWSNTLTPGAANIIFSAQTITKTGLKQNQDSQIDKTNYSAGLAGIYSSFSRNLPGTKDPWFLFLIAIIITIVSGLIVIFIKWKMRKNP